MTRAELVQKLTQSNVSLTPAQAEKSVEILLHEITSAIAKGQRVELRGFGVFISRQRKARLGRNPRTGDHVKVEAKKVPFFKAGKQMRDLLNKNS
ncbi:integration host factor subunit beta [Caedimonas varicaedens]|uniref:Integration host factor subunit beta n=1 Tax=Caedimonas varicaedens TaxID=1629334 RepID=A0A0K8MBK9_9PROT|nr:integration host factor subunit beta [Caedimonas varicaedens]